MRYENDGMTGLNIAYIGGGSSGWARTFMTDLALDGSLSGTVRLYDLDQEAAQRNALIGNRLRDRPEAAGCWTYVTSPTLAQALEGADFVVISILPGTFREMAADVHMPERLGIYQSVGDTTGPGGIIRALRTLPMFAEIGQAVKRYAPDAWVINYTNPMAAGVRTLYEVFPQVKAFGCCHEVFNTQSVLRNICKMRCGMQDVIRRDILVNVLGLNHFTWFSEASCRGIDLFPVYRDYVQEHFAEGYDDPEKDWRTSTFHCAHRVKFDLFRRYGLIAAAGDRHLAEFMPGREYLADPETVRGWKFSLTPVSWRVRDQEERLERSRRLAAGEEQLPLEPTGEEGILLIRALCGLDRVVSNVNVPNTAGQIPNMPRDTVVETNAVFSRDSIRPVFAGAVPANMEGIMAPHVANQERVMRAALERDRTRVYEAFLTDPLVAGRASVADVRKLADDMIAATAAYLPAGW